MRQNSKFNNVKNALNNICNTVMGGQGPSSTGGPLRSSREARKMHTFDFPVQTYLTSVRSNFEEEKLTGKSLIKNRPLDKTAMVTGISKSTIKESTR